MRKYPFSAAVLTGLAAVLLFYGWTAWGSGAWPIAHGDYPDYYSRLVHGLLHGHTYLDVPVDPAMVAAKDPYDYSVWWPHGMMADASYYAGHYYLYFGVTPAVAFLLPYHLLTGSDLALGSAVFLTTSAAFLLLAALWWRVRALYFSRSDAVLALVALLVLGLNPGMLALLRRPSFYELPIAVGILLIAGMAHALLFALGGKRRAVWMALAGLCWGLSAGCRPPLFLAGLAPAVLCGWCLRRRDYRPVGALVGTAGGIGALLMAYNFARFGRPLEFGFGYQLTNPAGLGRHFAASRYVGYNFSAYFLNGLRWMRHYPFYEIQSAGQRPADYFNSEWVYGLFKYAPVILFIPLAAGRPRTPWFILLLGTWAGPLAFDLAIKNSAARYFGDFLPMMLLTATVGAMALEERCASQPARGVAGALWLLAGGFTAAVAAVVSIPLYGSLQQHLGTGASQRIARALNRPAFLYERLRGWHYGPVTLHVEFPAGGAEEKLVATPSAVLVADYPAPGRARLGLRFADHAVWSRPLPAGGPHEITARFGALFPEIEHPYYLKHPFAAENRCAFQVEFDGARVLGGYALLPSADCSQIAISRGRAREGAGWFAGDIQVMERNRGGAPQDWAAQFEPWTFTFRAPGPGRWPIWSTGAGDFFLLEVASGGQARYGYGSKGGEAQLSSWFPLKPGSPLVLTIGAADLTPAGVPPGSHRAVWAEQDGVPIWRIEAPTSGYQFDSIRVGRNPGGGSADEFPGPIRAARAVPRRQPASADQTLLLQVVLPAERDLLMRDPIVVLGTPPAADALTMLYYDDTHVRFALDHFGLGPVLEGSVVNEAERDRPHEIEISLRQPGKSEMAGAAAEQGRVKVTFDGRVVLDASTPIYPPALDQISVGANPGGMIGEKQFHGTILSQRWLPTNPAAAPPAAP